MRIQFCGADRTVTGSSHLLEINGLRIFLDMGLYQGSRAEAEQLNGNFPAEVKSANAIILSHGHLDHCGKLPAAVRAGFAGPIYCTPPTAEVARIVLNDAAKIQMEDADHLNRHCRSAGECQVSPLYTDADVPPVLTRFRTVGYQQPTDLGGAGGGVRFTFYDAGHILGSAYVVLEWSEVGRARSLLFTADVGRYGAPILRDPFPIPGSVDQVITESTYGNSAHGPIENVGPQLLEAVKWCIERKSRLIVPSFAVGRTQTILWYLEKFIQSNAIPQIPIFVDSPMGVEVSKLHGNFREYYDDETNAMIGKKDLFGLARVTFASTVEQSKAINRVAGPCAIVASSPTCEFGRVLHHLERSVGEPNDTIVFVGWIPPRTLGRRLQEGDKRVRIYDRWYDVRCSVRTIHGLSAHADGGELLRFLKPTTGPGTEAFVVHGEVPQAEGFAQRLLSAGMGRATVPAMETSLVEYRSATSAPRAPGATDRD